MGRLIAWTFEHGHRAGCSGVLLGGLLDVLELEAAVEVVQSCAADQYRLGHQRRRQSCTCEQRDCWGEISLFEETGSGR